MGILSNTVYSEYERELDRIFVVQSRLTVYTKKLALDTVLNRIQWGGQIAYGYIFPAPAHLQTKLDKVFDKRLIMFMETLNKHQNDSPFQEVLILIEKLKGRPLNNDEVLAYELDIAINRVNATKD